MSEPDAGEALCLGFDHGAEVIAAPYALLLQVVADGLQVLVRQCLAVTGSGSLTGVCAKKVEEIGGMFTYRVADGTQALGIWHLTLHSSRACEA